MVGHSLPAVTAALIVAAGAILYVNQLLPFAAQGGAPSSFPTQTVALRGAGAPWRVGLQIGHLNAAQLPDELRRLRTSTGAYADGTPEVEINQAVARAVADLLEAAGVDVVLLPATIPPGFDADAFVAIHADGINQPAVRGYKVSPPWRASPSARLLVAALHDHYGQTTGLPVDLNGVTYNMRGYYAFSGYRYCHAIADTTPAAILELGYLSNAQDRAFLRGRPEVAAQGIAAGVLAYLEQRDPFDRWDTLPVTQMTLRARRPGIAVHASPDRKATVRIHLEEGDVLLARGGVGDWYDVRVGGSYRSFGWVHAADLGVPLPIFATAAQRGLSSAGQAWWMSRVFNPCANRGAQLGNTQRTAQR